MQIQGSVRVTWGRGPRAIREVCQRKEKETSARSGHPSWRSFAGSEASDHSLTKIFFYARVVRSSISGKTTKRIHIGCARNGFFCILNI
jgi:hypothetical protein